MSEPPDVTPRGRGDGLAEQHRDLGARGAAEPVAGSPRPVGRSALGLRQWLSLTVLLAGTFVTVLDNYIVLVAVPDIRAHLAASFAEAEFIVAAYSLTFAIGMITSGRLGDRFGRRRMLMIGFAGFTLASALCGLSPSPEELIVSRVAQGIAAAILTPQVFAIIRVMFTERHQRAVALAVMGVMIGLASVLGQIVGGFVIAADVAGLSWRPIFLINVPIGICALAAAPMLLHEMPVSRESKLDIVGAALSALGLWLLLFPLVEGREEGWPDWTVAMLVGSLVTLLVFGFHQHAKTRRQTNPLLDTSLFGVRSFTVGLGLILLFYATLSPFFLCFTYLVQIGFAMSAFQAALYFSPLAISFAIASFVAGRLAHRDARRILVVGALIVAVGSLSVVGACVWVPSLRPIDLTPSLAVLRAGQGLFMTPVINVVLSGVPDDHAGAASGVLATMQRTGAALGVAVLQIPSFATLAKDQSRGLDRSLAYVSAFSSVALCVFLLALIVTGLLFLLPRQKPVLVEE